MIMDNKCRKFEANIFNKAKCQHCFKSKEEHSAEALENSRVCTAVFFTRFFKHPYLHSHNIHCTCFYHATACNATHSIAKRVHFDKTKETSAHIFIRYERTVILVFQHEEWLVRDDPLHLKFWVILTPFEQQRRFSIDILW